MRPFKRVKMLNANEYRVLKKAVNSRKIAAGKARRAKILSPSEANSIATAALASCIFSVLAKLGASKSCSTMYYIIRAGSLPITH